MIWRWNTKKSTVSGTDAIDDTAISMGLGRVEVPDRLDDIVDFARPEGLIARQRQDRLRQAFRDRERALRRAAVSLVGVVQLTARAVLHHHVHPPHLHIPAH